MTPRPATQIQMAIATIQRHHAAIQRELRTIEKLSRLQHGSTGRTDQSVAKSRRSRRSAKP